MADDNGVFMEDDVLWQIGDFGEGDVGGERRDGVVEVRDDEGDDGEDGDGDNRWDQEVAAFGLGKGEIGHGGKDTAKNDCSSLVSS